MKHLLSLFVSLLSTATLLQAQVAPYNVVFDLTSKDTNDHQAVIRWMNAISKEKPDAKLEVVLYGQSLDMIRKDRSTVAPAIQQLSQHPNASVKVCAVAMKHHNLDASQILPGVVIVPDGIYEIVSCQRDGWGYIKVAH